MAVFKLFNYDPSLAAAALFTVLFALTSIFHTYQLIRTRTWYFTALVVGGALESAGYIARIVCSQQTPDWTLGVYIIQAIFLLVAPALFSASIYMVLGRLIKIVNGQEYCVINLRWLTKIFVTGDIISFLVLSGGGGMQSSHDTNIYNLGSKVVLIGLIIQVISFGIFVSVAIVFHMRMNKNPKGLPINTDLPWRKHIIVLYTASTLIMIRSIIRVVEYAQGFSGYILSHEVYLYVFDGTLMFIALVIFNWIHPSELIPGRKSLPEADSPPSTSDETSENVIGLESIPKS